jgi:hypothetical protein
MYKLIFKLLELIIFNYFAVITNLQLEESYIITVYEFGPIIITQF